MTAEALPAWNIFKQICAEHWDGFKRVHPRYDTRCHDRLVDKMLDDPCGMPVMPPVSQYKVAVTFRII